MKTKKRRASAREPRVPRRRAVVQPVPQLQRSMPPLEYVRWMVYSLFAAAVFSLPFAVVAGLFRHWVDVPGCTADCAALHRAYASYRSLKVGGICTCLDAFGQSSSFHASYTLTHGHSLTSALLEAIASIGTMLALAAAWYWLLYSLIQRLPLSFWRRDTKPEKKT